MKLVIRFLIASILCIGMLSINLKSTSELKIKQPGSGDFSAQWQNLFTIAVRPPGVCSPPNKIKKEDDEYQDDDGVESLVPKAKPNKWAKNQGFGPSAYFFDYLDDVFKNDVLAQFNAMWTAARAMPPAPSNVFAEPYSLDVMIYQYSNGAKGSLDPANPSGSPAQLAKTIATLNKNFDPAIFDNSISAAQLWNIIKEWGWQNIIAANPIKKLVDRFDFNGDGRLNQYEFILMSIVHNQKLFLSSDCKKFCYFDLIKNKIDPIFAFSDCDGDGYVSSENLWNSFPYLRRSQPSLYNMFNCIMPNVLNKGYRTTSPNDFILKNSVVADGFVNLNEFRKGILYGYWDRYTDTRAILADESKSLKNFRWGNNGATDIVCNNILALIPGATIPAVYNPITTPPPTNQSVPSVPGNSFNPQAAGPTSPVPAQPMAPNSGNRNPLLNPNTNIPLGPNTTKRF